MSQKDYEHICKFIRVHLQVYSVHPRCYSPSARDWSKFKKVKVSHVLFSDPWGFNSTQLHLLYSSGLENCSFSKRGQVWVSVVIFFSAVELSPSPRCAEFELVLSGHSTNLHKVASTKDVLPRREHKSPCGVRTLHLVCGKVQAMDWMGRKTRD